MNLECREESGMLAPSFPVSQSSMAMDESLLPSNEEVEAFNDKVDEVTGLIAGLQARAA